MNGEVIVIIITQSILFIGALFKLYSDMQMKLRELDLRMTAVEKREFDMSEKLDRIIDVLQSVRLELKDKLNR